MYYQAFTRQKWTFALLFILPFTFSALNASANLDINQSSQLSINALVEEAFKYRFAPWQPNLLSAEEQQHNLWLRFPVTNSEIVHPVLSVDYQQQELPTLYLKYIYLKYIYLKYISAATGKTVVKPLPLDQVNTTSFTLLPAQSAMIYLKAPFHPELIKALNSRQHRYTEA